MRVFISYARDNIPQASALAADLSALGHEVWFDKELAGGQAWWDQILRRIRECDAFVFALSPESLESPACDREWRYGSKLGKNILPALNSGEISDDLLPPLLAEIQYVDYRQQDKQAVLRLTKALTAMPAPRPLPDPLPVSPDVPMSYLGSLREQIQTAANLSFQEQTAILVTLKQGLREEKSETRFEFCFGHFERATTSSPASPTRSTNYCRTAAPKCDRAQRSRPISRTRRKCPLVALRFRLRFQPTERGPFAPATLPQGLSRRCQSRLPLHIGRVAT